MAGFVGFVAAAVPAILAGGAEGEMIGILHIDSNLPRGCGPG